MVIDFISKLFIIQILTERCTNEYQVIVKVIVGNSSIGERNGAIRTLMLKIQNRKLYCNIIKLFFTGE